MANETKFKSQLQLVFHIGEGEDGNAILRRKNFNNVKTEATAEQLYAVSQSLANLQSFHSLVLYETIHLKSMLIKGI